MKCKKCGEENGGNLVDGICEECWLTEELKNWGKRI